MNQVYDVRDLLGNELTQRRQSGYEVEDGLADKIRAAAADGSGATLQEAVGLYEQLDQTGLRAGWEYEEPSALDDIVAAAPQAPAAGGAPGGAELSDRVLAAWLGRCAGCNLGKPVEGYGWNRPKLREYLDEAKAYPLADYIPVLDPMPERFTLHPSWPAATRA